MTLQIRWLVADPYSLDYKEEWTEWRTILDHADWVPDNANKFDVREKPIFEPGYFIDLSLLGENRERSSFAGEPYQVRFFTEDPGKYWERVTVYDGDNRCVTS